MKSSIPASLMTFCALLLLTAACHSEQEGAVEGSVVPPDSRVRITISRSGTTVRSVTADEKDGTFRAALAPGTYDINISSPSAPFPVLFPGISIVAGRTATLPPVELASAGKAVISGTVFPIVARGSVDLLYEGKERATVDVGEDGRYEFSELPSGNYSLRATSPGYAADTIMVHIGKDRITAQNMRLLYISAVDGIDWDAGVIRATGRGRYPANSTNRTVMREMARRAAISDAERNLLTIIRKIKLDPAHDLGSVQNRRYSINIRGFLRDFSVVEERETDDGIELELEIPLSGAGGLTRVLAE